MNVQLVNCGMTNRRFWKVAREEVGAQLELTGPKTKVVLKTMIRGNLYGDHDLLRSLRSAYKTKVVIIFGWEWASKSWKLKEDLIFHLRETAAEENVAVIIYSQARTSPKLGRFDRGGVGRLSSIALDLERIDEDEKGESNSSAGIVVDTKPPISSGSGKEPKELKEIKDLTVEDLLESTQLSYSNINDLNRVRLEEGEPFEREIEYV